jgi:hypothetical protein
MKKSIYVTIGLFIIIGTYVTYFFLKPINYENGIATITYNDEEIAYAKIDGINDKNNKNIIINSTIFQMGEKINVKYYKKYKKYYITALKYQASMKEEKNKLVKNIFYNQNLKKYREKVSFDVENNDLPYDKKFPTAIPVKISNQEFNIINIIDYVNYIFPIYPNLGVPSDEKIIITFLEDFEILKLESIYRENNNISSPQKMNYQLNDNNIIINSIGLGAYYIARIKLSNGDIIDYVFH